MKSFKLIIILLFASLLGVSQNITRMEYFVDNDPGYGNAVSIPFTGSEIAEADFTVPLNSLGNGIHFLYLRAQNQDGDWSVTSVHHILKDVFQSENAVIDHAEYYIDNDPGFGNGTAISVSSGNVVDVAFNLDVSALSTGLHFLNLRTRTNDGSWSLTHSHHIMVDVFQSVDTEISEIEYFIDTDPGPGNATSVSISQGKVVDVTFQADLSGLTPGIHFINARAKTTDNTWGNPHIHPVFIDVLGTEDSEITGVEYFIDTDPGIGKATPVSILPGKVIDLTFNLDLNGRDPGFHFLSVRSVSDDNTWSHAYTSMFLMDVLDAGESPITQLEYFIDTDPGIGNATEVNITPGNVVEMAFEVDLNSLDPGFHFISVRSASENNTWSHAYTSMFLMDVLDAGESPITKVEYFVDEDPGIGNATNVAITPGKVVDLAFDVDLSNLESGFHFLSVRSASENDTWSHAYTSMFLMDVLDTGEEPIVAVEYFIDEDPGYGNATQVSITPGNVVDFSFEIDLIGLEPGFHFVTVRSKSVADAWSMGYYQMFYLDHISSINDPNLVALEYFLDEDPGFGNGTSVAINPPVSVADKDFIVPLGNVEPGEHILYMRALDEFNNWSIVAYDTVQVELGSDFALRFDGVDDYLEAGEVSFPEDDLTIEAWINPAELSGYQEIVFWHGEDDDVQFRIQENGSLLYGEAANGNWSYIVSAAGIILPNLWTHVALTKEGDLCNLYVNGINVGFYQFDNNPVMHTLQIGGRGRDLDRFFDGDIDEVRIWNVARTQEELMENFCTNFIGSEEGIYGLWHFNEGPGTSIAFDSGPNGFGAWLLNMEYNTGPECAWIEHSCELPPEINLAVTSIYSPNNLLLASASDAEAISIQLRNFGTETYYGEATISYKLNEGDAVSEITNLNLDPGDYFEFNFNVPVDLSIPDSYELKSFVTAIGDEYQANDTLVKVIQSVELQRSVFAYNAWPNVSGLPKGPIVFDLENPEYLFSLADQSNENAFRGGTWMDGKWWAIANDTLYIIDTITGNRNFVGVPGSYISSMAYDPVGEKLYGHSWVSLYEIDPLSGISTYIGHSGTEGFAALACNAEGNLIALNVEDDQIYQINKEYGEATAIGPIGFDARYDQDMDFDPVTGNIYLTAYNNDEGQGELRTVDPISGNATYLGTFRGGMEVTGFAIPIIDPLQPPVAEFTADPLSGKVPLEVQFSDFSTGTVDGRLWDFGDGNTSTDQHPEYTYTEPGIYTVSLTVTNAGGSDTETKESYIEVEPLTIYDLQYTTIPGPDNTYPSIYADMTVTVSGLVYANNVNGTGNAFFITAPEGGSWNGIFVYNANIEPALGDEVVLTGLVTEYNGLTEIHTPEGSILSSGNPLPSVQIIATGDLLTAAIAEPYESCLVQVQNVTVTQIANEYGQWYVDDVSGECQVDDRIYAYAPYFNESLGFIRGPVYYGFGTYAINPRDEDDIQNNVFAAEFIASTTSGFVPLSVDFSDLSTGDPDSWLWEFGDGEMSTLQNPSHVYATFGIYTVSLTTYKDGAEDTEIKEGYIEVYQTQNGDWSLQHICLEDTPEAELMIRAGDIDNLGFGWPAGFDPFTGQSTSQHGFPWEPDPEDTGGTDRIMVVTSHTGSGVPCWNDGYTNTTSRPENLPEPILIDLCQLTTGEINSATLQIFVDDLQPISFCSEFTVKLNGLTFAPLQTIINSIDQSGPIGRMLTVRLPDELLYLLEGEQLELEIDDFTTGAGDGFAIDFVKLLINEGALVHSGSIDGNVYDAQTSQPIEAAEVEASFWETALTISDGSYSIDEVPAGLVYVECRAQGYFTQHQLINLSSDENLMVNFWLEDDFSADFSGDPLFGYVPLAVQFTDLSAGNPVSWAWQFGDGGTSNLQHPVHLYTSVGDYDVTLTVFDGTSYYERTRQAYVHVENEPLGEWLAEYFFDVDPGFGLANPVYAGAKSSTIEFEANTANLDEGYHTMYIRTKDVAGAWSQTLARSFLVARLPQDIRAQMTQVEYFLDHDPGFGKGDIILVDPEETVEIPINVNLWDQDEGFHNLFIRGFDNYGNWGQAICRPFLVNTLNENVRVERMEYFIDIDPGIGNGMSVTLDPSEIVSKTFLIDLSGQSNGEHMLFVRAEDNRGGWSIVYNALFEVDPNSGAVHIVDLPQGWSGISSFVVPDESDVATIFEPIVDDMAILQNFDGMYWPFAGVNTIGNWNDVDGYQVKMETAQQVIFIGTMQDKLIVNLEDGWNYLPVPNACNNFAEDLFSEVSGSLKIVKEVAGPQVYWPQFGINTLNLIVPGKAYFVLVDEDLSVEFQECALDEPGEGQHMYTPSPSEKGWGEVKTPITHTIAVPMETMTGLKPGDIIGVYGSNGQCFGAVAYQNQNLALTAFGDDPITTQIDGLAEGETLQLRVFNAETSNEYPLEVEFDAQMPQGEYFVNHGLSAVKSLQATGVGGTSEMNTSVNVYPNPSNAKFNIQLENTNEKSNWEVLDVHGNILMNGNDQYNNFNVDLSTYPKGIYYLKISRGGLLFMEKLVLQ